MITSTNAIMGRFSFYGGNKCIKTITTLVRLVMVMIPRNEGYGLNSNGYRNERNFVMLSRYGAV